MSEPGSGLEQDVLHKSRNEASLGHDTNAYIEHSPRRAAKRLLSACLSDILLLIDHRLPDAIVHIYKYLPPTL